MFRGMMIDELIAAVARAEVHARAVDAAEHKPQQPVISEPVYTQVVYQTPFIAAVMGAA